MRGVYVASFTAGRPLGDGRTSTRLRAFWTGQPDYRLCAAWQFRHVFLAATGRRAGVCLAGVVAAFAFSAQPPLLVVCRRGRGVFESGFGAVAREYSCGRARNLDAAQQFADIFSRRDWSAVFRRTPRRLADDKSGIGGYRRGADCQPGICAE